MNRRMLIPLLFVSVCCVPVAYIAYIFDKHNQARHATGSASKMKGLGCAMHNYYGEHKHFPPSFGWDKQRKHKHSWRVTLLQFFDGDLYKRYRFDEPWDSKANKEIERAGARYYCMRPETLIANYYVVTGDQTLFPKDGGVLADDILSRIDENTILVVESSTVNAHWMEPIDIEFENLSFLVNDRNGPSISSAFADRCNVCLARGVIISLSSANTDRQRLENLLLIPKNEVRDLVFPR